MSFKPAVFYNEVKEELAKVSWPSKEQTLGTTTVVLVVVALLTAYLGGIDFILARVAAAIMGS
ncbi:MAG: preprotein translocase subunit SecE [Deferribacteraceae bacterium]|jgi:preprotein translocase subunit SecE|nr:preprotein translocase subunit SecE [Deferribacteraceae bacterium]